MSQHTDPPSIPPPGAPKEPLLTAAAVATGSTLILAAIVSFGLPINDDQQAKVLALLLFLAPFIAAGIGRIQAWSPASVRKLALAERAKAQGQP